MQGNRDKKTLSVSVVVPTYQRPDYLERCVKSLFAQTRLPDEIILVSRDTDELTNQKIAVIKNELGETIIILNPQVDEPGFLPPIKKGIELARNDIVAFLDDDAEAFPDWLERIVAFYSNPDIGGIGGRCINYFDFKLVTYPKADKVGHLSWYGRIVGNMYKDTTFSHPVAVDSLMGGNMSYRRQLLNQIKIDPVINSNVAFHWELDMAQQIKKLGCKLLFDPAIKVNHYSAPREVDGLRTVNSDGVYYSNFNYAYLMLKHLTLPGKLAYIIYTFMVGSQLSSGLLHLLVQVVRQKKIDWRNDILPSLKGRLSGISAYAWKTAT